MTLLPILWFCRPHVPLPTPASQRNWRGEEEKEWGGALWGSYSAGITTKRRAGLGYSSCGKKYYGSSSTLRPQFPLLKQVVWASYAPFYNLLSLSQSLRLFSESGFPHRLCLSEAGWDGCKWRAPNPRMVQLSKVHASCPASKFCSRDRGAATKL